MARNSKRLGILLAAALATSAMVASSALAAQFHSEITVTKYTGKQLAINTFTTGAGETECETGSFEGTVFGATTTTEILLGADYADCTTFGLESDIDMNGCEFLLTSHGMVHLLGCDAGEHIEITVLPDLPFCTITVFEQTVSNAVSYTNEGSGISRSIIIDAHASGITYEVDGGWDLCGEEDVLTHDGSYDGPNTVEGEDSGGSPVGVWLE